MDIDARLNGSAEAAQARVLANAREAAGNIAMEAARSGNGDEAAKSFEQMLSRMFVKELRRGMETGFFGKGPGADVFESWLNEHLGDALTETDTLGIAGMVKAGLGIGGERVEPPSYGPQVAVPEQSTESVDQETDR